MTRRGSLAYYLAATVVGCFFASLFLFLALEAPLASTPRRAAADFFGFYFISVPYGVFAAVLSAAMLRWLTSALRWYRLSQWMLCGAAISTVLVVVLYLLGLVLSHSESELSLWATVFLGGPSFVVLGGVWPATLAGALTAVVLRRIHQVFQPRAAESANPGEPSAR
jgi:hypothetical protein